MKKYRLKPFITKNIINYKENLNPQQLEVVEKADGPSLVLAGAGSGKTRVLIYRLAYLLEKGIDPRNILLVTFTNKAAAEMIHRAEALLKRSLTNLWAGTFHHIGNIILRKEASSLGYSSNFTIIDKEDSKDLIDDCIEELGLSNKKLFPKKDIISHIWSLAVNSLKEVEEIILNFYPHIEEFTSQIKRLLDFYNRKKKEANIMDFDDLLLGWLSLLKIEEIKNKYSRIFQYILVDEYQDTNRIQFEILKKISGYHRNILVVGDDAQSIYSFRGAEINNLLDFPTTFKGTKIFKLEINYRSPSPILNLANNIIKHNINQFPKQLRAIKSKGKIPVVVKTEDVYMQARFVSQRILEIVEEGIPLKEIAVLFRSRYQALELEVELMKRNIPYLVRGGLRFFEQAHIKDILSYLKFVTNPKDELSFKRAISLHKGIGRGFANKIWRNLTTKGMDMEEIYRKLPARQKEGFKEFMDLIRKIKKISGCEKAIREIISSYRDYCYLSFDNPEDRILDLEELAKMAKNYPTIKRFLYEVSSYEEFKGETLLSGYSKEDLLVLSTIHQAKGLEWEVVFIIGFCDYEFPHPKALNDPKALEEERRLFYVATTRSKEQLYIVYPQHRYTLKNGLIISRASMFLYELDRSCLEEWTAENYQNL
ncbi:MAG: ATP-dependent helicase [Candidatus Omnitrophica bacterium]|nr:ATP-dependent helicase [Candidatus Omnitrophota bacterium]